MALFFLWVVAWFGCAGSSRNNWSIPHRKAARVLPEPVGARMRVCSPRWMAGQPCVWYGQAMKVVRKVINQSAQNAAPVDDVVRAVIHALTARRPKTRYPVGRWAATTIWLFKLLPDRLRDWLIMQRR